ncbi:MAG TPA: hypothetical protein VJY62_13325, partial [Bacteroidia bacterium]|nr:hypothetical protein [Bacteroidia bacterium]
MKTLTKIALALLIVTLCSTGKTFSQSFCATKGDIPDYLQSIPAGQFQAGSTHYCIRIFIHVMRRTNGTGGQTLAEVNQGLSILRADYLPHDISFLLIGYDEILNDTYYNMTGFTNDVNQDGKFDNFSPNSNANAIDIYMFGNDVLNSGQAAWIPASALVIGGAAFGINLASSHVLSHEMGHCLGLFHSFHGMNCEGPSIIDPGACHELVNGTNCSTCGDYVCDTPADPTRFNVNQATCLWPGTVASCEGSLVDANGDTYAPDPNLIMAYVTPNCMYHHTTGQGTRMNSMIANSTILQNTVETPGAADLSAQDFTNDLGFEPNPNGGAMWISEDIWVRHIADGLTNHTHLNPEAGQINFVYVRVRNIGCQPSAGLPTELLKLYWAKASSALDWDDYWDGTLICSGSGEPMGGFISDQPIPVIAAGDEHIFEFQWTPAQPALYTNCNLCYDPAEFWHFCMLARIVDTNLPDDGMTFPEGTGLYTN